MEHVKSVVARNTGTTNIHYSRLSNAASNRLWPHFQLGFVGRGIGKGGRRRSWNTLTWTTTTDAGRALHNGRSTPRLQAGLALAAAAPEPPRPVVDGYKFRPEAPRNFHTSSPSSTAPQPTTQPTATMAASSTQSGGARPTTWIGHEGAASLDLRSKCFGHFPLPRPILLYSGITYLPFVT